MSLIAKIRQARLHPAEAAGLAFTLRRPTDLEVARMRGEGVSPFDIVLRFVVGWQVKESDLIAGGSDAAVPWDADLFAEWVVDRPELWEPLGGQIMAAYAAHRAGMEASAKN
jgi:hypothetical protein